MSWMACGCVHFGKIIFWGELFLELKFTELSSFCQEELALNVLYVMLIISQELWCNLSLRNGLLLSFLK